MLCDKLVLIIGLILYITVFLEKIKTFGTVEFLAYICRGEVKLLVAETDGIGVGNVAAIVNLFYICPADSTEAHRARFCGGVEFASVKVEGAEDFTCGSYSHYFAVAGRIIAF